MLIMGDKPVLVEFTAEWCGPCKLMAPVLLQVKENVGEHAVIIKMDIDQNPDFAFKFNVQSVPTIIIFRHGKIAWRASGVQPAKVLVQEIAKLQF